MSATYKVKIIRSGMDSYTDMYEVLTFHAGSEVDLNQWLDDEYSNYQIIDGIPDS